MDYVLQIFACNEYFNFRLLFYYLPLILSVGIIRSDDFICIITNIYLLLTIIMESCTYMFYRSALKKYKLIYYFNLLVFILANIKKFIFSIVLITTPRCQKDDGFVFIIGYSILIQTIITTLNTCALFFYLKFTNKENSIDYNDCRSVMDNIVEHSVPENMEYSIA